MEVQGHFLNFFFQFLTNISVPQALGLHMMLYPNNIYG